MEKLRVYPDPILLQVAEVCSSHLEARDIADQLLDMCSKVEWGNCAGMAAPQIGISKRVFVAEGVVYINPNIIYEQKTGSRLYQEGCYSLERERYNYVVRRPYSLLIEWTTYVGDLMIERFVGEHAQIIHHEFQHLDGLLCNQNESLLTK